MLKELQNIQNDRKLNEKKELSVIFDFWKNKLRPSPLFYAYYELLMVI